MLSLSTTNSFSSLFSAVFSPNALEFIASFQYPFFLPLKWLTLLEFINVHSTNNDKIEKKIKTKPQILIKPSHSYRIEKFNFYDSVVFIPEADCIFAICMQAIADDQVIFHIRSDQVTGSFRVCLTRTMKPPF